jgi:hypothetical protein
MQTRPCKGGEESVREVPIEGATLGFVKEFCKRGMVGIIDRDKKVLHIEEGVHSWLLYSEAPSLKQVISR